MWNNRWNIGAAPSASRKMVSIGRILEKSIEFLNGDPEIVDTTEEKYFDANGFDGSNIGFAPSSTWTRHPSYCFPLCGPSRNLQPMLIWESILTSDYHFVHSWDVAASKTASCVRCVKLSNYSQGQTQIWQPQCPHFRLQPVCGIFL